MNDKVKANDVLGGVMRAAEAVTARGHGDASVMRDIRRENLVRDNARVIQEKSGIGGLVEASKIVDNVLAVLIAQVVLDHPDAKIVRDARKYRKVLQSALAKLKEPTP